MLNMLTSLRASEKKENACHFQSVKWSVYSCPNCSSDSRWASKTLFPHALWCQIRGGCLRPFLYLYETDNPTPTARCDWPAAWRWKRSRGLNFSFQLSLTQRFLSLFVRIAECNAMNVFQEKACTVIPIFKQYRVDPLSMTASLSRRLCVLGTTINTCPFRCGQTTLYGKLKRKLSVTSYFLCSLILNLNCDLLQSGTVLWSMYLHSFWNRNRKIWKREKRNSEFQLF